MTTPRRLTILGATGSIGRSVSEVALANPGCFEVVAVVGGRDAAALAQAAISLGARFAALADPGGLEALRAALSGSGIACGAGDAAVLEAASRDVDIVASGISGFAGLAPTLAALAPGRRIALANKETLVCAGAFFMGEAKRIGATILPMDSEHNAVAQALGGRPLADVATITLTASGGPFRGFTADEIRDARPEQALRHPNYAMGAKITIDSASLLNKGLELIEAHHLFGIEAERLRAVIHPQQIVHGLVSFTDGSVVAGMATPDMRVPIADCLALGPRLVSGVPPVDLGAVGTLTFEPPDHKRFPCLKLAIEALHHGGAATNALNAAGEVAVAAFLERRLKFGGIADVIAATLEAMSRHMANAPGSVDEAVGIDHMSRSAARDAVKRLGA
jgi:1-deoxy-D-xylulose-5-phosphate reductoisomerase